MADQDFVIAKRYAKALFDLAREQKKLENVEADLQLLLECLDNSAELRAVIENPSVSRAALQQILSVGVLKDQLNNTTYNFLQLLVRNRRMDLVKKIVQAFRVYLDEHRDAVVAKITVAKALTSKQEKELAKTLSQSTGKTVKIETVIDEQILGGLVIKIGSTMLDGSVAGQLEELKRISKQAVTTL